MCRRPCHPRRGDRRRGVGVGVFAALAICTALGQSPAALAGDVPPSAYSLALGIEPFLLEDIDLVFEFPQWAAMRDSIELAFGRTIEGAFLQGSSDFDEFSAGTRFGLGPATLFALSQRSYVLRPVFGNPGNVVQIGTALGGSGLRGGVALRGWRAVDELFDRSSYPGFRRDIVQQATTDYLGGSAGIGLMAGRLRIDAAVEVASVELEVSGLSQNNAEVTTLWASGGSDGLIAGSLHAGVPLGDRARFVAGGRFQAGEIAWTGQRYVGSTPSQFARSFSVESWLAGATVGFTAPRVDAVLLSASFERLRDAFTMPDYGGERSEIGRDDTARVGIALGKRLWRVLDMHAAVTRTWLRDWRQTERIEPTSSDLRSQRTDRLTDRFSWGVSYRWRGIRFTGALDEDLTLFDPFMALDVQIEL